ncbi:MAG: hypothetical protein ABI551_04230, partial [Polyangiaceae bacterium]
AVEIDVAPSVASRARIAPPPTHHVSRKTTRRDLAPQVALLDRARSSTMNGDATQALELVRQYRSGYPHGTFEQEADVVEIEALEKDGDGDAARVSARRFLAAHPSSVHAAQVRGSTGL